MLSRLAACFAVCLLTLVVLCGATPPASADAPAGFGNTLVPGTGWCRGMGVDVYWNGAVGYVYDGERSLLNGVDVGIKWQCVELATRLYNARSWHSGKFGVSSAYQIWDRAPLIGMERKARGSGYVPVPGDMMVFDTGIGIDGHVSVVDRVEGSTVHVCEQNYSSTGRRE